MTAAVETPRATGRPRDPELDHRIVEATLQLLADGG